MDALDILRVLRRRWQITAAVAAAFAVLVGAVLFLVPQQYKVTAIALVTPASNQDVQNPYTVSDQAQSRMAALLVTVLTAPATADGYVAKGANGTIEVTNANGVTDTSQTDSPFITITVTDLSAAGAVHGAQVVRQRAIDELKNRQDAAQVAAAQRLTLTDVLPTTDAVTTHASQLRAVGLVAALGLVLGVLGIVVADRVLVSRAKRREAAEAEEAATPPAATPPAPKAPPTAAGAAVEKLNGANDHRRGVLPAVTSPADSPTIKFSPVRSDQKQGGGSRR
ncbi:Wzz/FepE/Etk N-terminal domain-containing protein [Kutzneria buriramensis]|uniref:Capsular polysaccharide biosynthesis protein n=1 Tax=Kutzneria buriramensis TaxID=1045776 RepID=A0A3E0I952_9PSEU|nr:Wzz/FepE/Etk N-terminal domain-containing protein [Kutzneria buriramensis]REH55274.1 capsular polysaccharide biosynthesis protein [Kutzneria buriramensis]